MAEVPSKRDRRDWTLIIILLPIGILFMVLAGQLAIRLVPFWSVNGGMGSNLDPNSASGQNPSQIQPVSMDILTPMAWLESFLTPGPDSANNGVSFAPFVVFEPSSTPAVVASPALSNTPVPPPATPSVTSITTTTTTTTTTTKKKKPAPPPALCTDSTANNVGSPLPCTYTPVSSPLVGSSASIPGNTNVGPPDGNVGNVADGNYVTIDLSSNPIVVNGPSDKNYDFTYYELHVAPCSPAAPCPSGSGIQMDSVILSISVLNTGPYYVVFNWGDGVPDANSNIGDVASSTGTENDNQSIDSSQLAGSGSTQTGVQVDVDNAPSHPPVGNYSYLAIQAPVAPPADGNDGADVDSIQVVDSPPVP
jgi:hypothetical protein